MKINLDISSTITKYEKEISKYKEYLTNLPEEQICAHKRNNRYIYCLRSKDAQGKRSEKYLNSDQEQLVKECCEAAYLRKIISALEAEIRALKRFEKSYNPEEKIKAWDNLPRGYQFFATQLYRTKKALCEDWEHDEFTQNPYPIGTPMQYVTKKGETVRSRIELIVADILYDLGIPYRYECKLTLSNGNMYPDFTVMHPETLELYYIEIFGMMDNQEYELAAFSKIAKYAASDVYQHLLMFFDHKNAPISPANIKRTLANVFLSLDHNIIP